MELPDPIPRVLDPLPGTVRREDYPDFEEAESKELVPLLGFEESAPKPPFLPPKVKGPIFPLYKS